MSVTPEPDIIAVDTPPDSPIDIQDVSPGPPNSSHTTPSYSSPKKRPRQSKPQELCHPKRQQALMSASDAANDLVPSESQKNDKDENTYFGDSTSVGLDPNVEDGGITNLELHGPRDATPVELDRDEAYSIAVAEERAGLYPITRSLFVVQGWDEKGIVTTSWYHLQRVMIGDDAYMACTCRQSDPISSCVHENYLHRYWEDKFEYLNEVSWDAVDDRVVLFSRRTHDGTSTTSNIFSVAGSSASTPDYLNHRAIVFYEGQDSGDGMWTCSKDKQHSSCRHIADARHQLQKLLQADPNATDNNVHPATSNWLPTKEYDKDLDKAVSHCTILPPSWTAISTDRSLYPRPRPITCALEYIQLTVNQSTCICGAPFDPTKPVFSQPCIIYGLTEAFPSNIQLQACPMCPSNRRFSIGPDARELGIFNLNNRQLFTHELLNDYTSAYTTSETPFVAWVSVITRRYADRSSPVPFVSEDKFRDAWFAFSRLQDFEGDMICPHCGPSPDDVIWDGVTLGFSRKHVLKTMQPPTVIDLDHSLIRSKICYNPHQQLFPNPSFRKNLRNAINGPELFVLDEGGSNADLSTKASAASVELEHMENLVKVEEELRSYDTGLGNIFSTYFGIEARAQGKKAPAQFRRLFIQLAADESVLQLATRGALDDLEIFCQSPTPLNASRLVSIPALYDVLSGEQVPLGGTYDNSILSLCKWILNYGRVVLQKLITEPPLEEDFGATYNNDWRSTGCLYSMPQIRFRPQYPKLTHDQRKDSGGSRGAKCSKYYSQYGEQRLTGGIMGAWCTHSICYGFHFIPVGEGRNDVFSAMVTRWPKAPKRVIYDFACALGPYCLLREPNFFADTLFVIDDFHAAGHTKCCPAAFLSSYSRLDPRLRNLNSSAAECGNGGISRIRKSVSYMSQTRAFQYTRVFISVWNRNKIQKLEKKRGQL